MDAAMGALEPAAATHRVWRNPSPTKDELKQTIDQMYHAGGELLANKEEMEQKLKAQAKAALEFQRAGFQRAAEEAMQQVRDVNQVEIVNAERAVQQTMANALTNEQRAAKAAADNTNQVLDRLRITEKFADDEMKKTNRRHPATSSTFRRYAEG